LHNISPGIFYYTLYAHSLEIVSRRNNHFISAAILLLGLLKHLPEFSDLFAPLLNHFFCKYKADRNERRGIMFISPKAF
jgi:hypothetical protein